MATFHRKLSSTRWERNGITIVELCGSPEEMGRDHGRLLKKMIQHGYYNFVEKGVLPGIGRELFGDDAMKIAGFHDWCQKQAKKYVEKISPDLEMEIRAMAQEAELSWEQALFLQVILDVIELAGLTHSDQFFHSCTQVAFLPETTGGSTLVARNLDWPPFGLAQAISVLFHYIPDNGIPFWSQGFAGTSGVLTAMNHEGLVITEESLTETADVSDKGVPHCLLHREMAQYDSTIEAAKTRLIESPRNNGYHTLIASGKEEDALVVLTSAHHHAVRRARDSACWGIEPNRTPEMFDEGTLPHEHVPLTNDSSDIRYSRLRGLAENHGGPITVENCKAWLADDIDTATGLPGTSLHSISNDTTLHSFVADATNRKFHVAMGLVPAPRGGFVSFDLDESMT